jgi:hypothetical protein
MLRDISAPRDEVVNGEFYVTHFGRRAVVFAGHQAHESRMDKLHFDDTDYSVVVKNRAPPPNSWRWEICRDGMSSPIGQSPRIFRTMTAARKAGKAALKDLLAKLNT